MEDRVILVVVVEAVEAVPMDWLTLIVGNVVGNVLLEQMSSPTMTASAGQQGSFPHWGSVQ